MQKIRKQIFDNHSHIGPVSGFAYYGLPAAVKPTTDYDTINEYLGGMDDHGVDRGLVLPNYATPIQVSLSHLTLSSLKALSSLIVFWVPSGYLHYHRIRIGQLTHLNLLDRKG